MLINNENLYYLESEEFEDEFEKAAAMDTSDIKKESSSIFII